MRNIALLLLPCLTLGVGCSRDKESPPQSSRTERVSLRALDADDADSTEQTSPEELALSATPLDQGETVADLTITSSIRKIIDRDKVMTTDPQDITILTTAGGKVTLLGSAKSEHEKSKIEAYAKMTEGVNRVDNLLQVEKNP